MLSRYDALLADLTAEFPGFRIVRKDGSRLQRAIHVALAIVTLGAQRAYLTGYHTTLGRTVYVVPDWEQLPEDDRYVTLRHERAHLGQFRRYGFALMAVLYLLVPLPFGLAWFRARFEKEGYAETIRATAEVEGPAAVLDGALREHVVSQFVTGAYGWMWPFRRAIERWYDGVAREAARAEAARAEAPR